MPRAAASVSEVIAALGRAFRSLDVRWYVFGAQALVLRGCPRATADVDVTVLLDGTPTSRLVSVLKRAGFVLRFEDEAFVTATRVLPVVHRRTRLPVDIVLGGPGLEERFASGASPVRIGRSQVPVASTTHLVLMKALAGRPKDLEDAATLLSVRTDDIDQKELDELAKAMAVALDDTDVLDHLKQARRRAARVLASTSRKKPTQRRRKQR